MLRRYVPVVRRRVGVVVLGLMMGVFSAGAAHAQQAASPYVFTTDAVAFVHIIKAESAADYEAAMAKVKESLGKSEKPERKQQAASWKLYKASEAGPNGAVVYVWVVDPAVKGADYNFVTILTEGFPAAEVTAIYDKIKTAFVSQSKFSLNLLSDFGK